MSMPSATVHSGEGMWVKDGRGDPVLYSRANGVGQIYDLSRLLPSVDHIVVSQILYKRSPY